MSTPYFDKAEDKINRLKAEGHKVRAENIPFQAVLKDQLQAESKFYLNFL